MAPHSSTLAWKIPGMEEPGGLQSMGSLSRTRMSNFTFTFHFHGGFLFILASVCWSLQCLISTLTQGGGGGHFFRLTKTPHSSTLENPMDGGAW